MQKPTPIHFLGLIPLVLAVLSVTFFALAAPMADASADKPGKRELERQARGKLSYRAYCANCHGKKAEGDGPMAEVLKVPPPDLTRLSRDNGGEFPYLRTKATIDGRAEFMSHGSRAMPIWGLSFHCLDCDSDQEAEVRRKIEDLLSYLKTLQKSSEDPSTGP